jgi:HNH endonuclease/NUMOD4 motif
MTLLLEYWKPVVGFENYYLISNTGKLWSVRKKLYRVGFDDTRGYLNVTLSLDDKTYNRRIHRMVIEAFVGHRPTGLDINHIDGNKRNNRISNLEYVTRAENLAHAFKLGLLTPVHQFKTGHIFNRTITVDDVRRIRASGGGKVLQALADELGLNICQLYKIRNGTRWGGVA